MSVTVIVESRIKSHSSPSTDVGLFSCPLFAQCHPLVLPNTRPVCVSSAHSWLAIIAKNPFICIISNRMVVRMRSTRSHTGNRRSHHALKAQGFALCANCKAPKRKHAVCEGCGQYKGRKAIDVETRLKKDTKKSQKTGEVKTK